jgi:cephalosporin-C deacetylase-like acetyl esterase
VALIFFEEEALMSNRKKYVILVIISIALVLIGSFAANLVQTDFCKVKITETTFVTEDGARLHALLLVPDSATVEKPAPAVVSAHGYNNTLEVQDINWVEIGRAHV